MDQNTAIIRRVDAPQGQTIRVAVDRLRMCPAEIGNECWPPSRVRKNGTRGTQQPAEPLPLDLGGQEPVADSIVKSSGQLGGSARQEEPGPDEQDDGDPRPIVSVDSSKAPVGKWHGRLRRRRPRPDRDAWLWEGVM